jgi:hypothetical protein
VDILPLDLGPPGIDRCEGGQQLAFVGGSATVSGDTGPAVNEFGQAIRCGGPVPYVGPQHYYRVQLKEGYSYRFRVQATFEAVTFLVPACSANAINADCGSNGASGDAVGPVPTGAVATLVFTATSSGDHVFAIDSLSLDQKGSYLLHAEEFAPPSNGQCQTAQALQTSGSQLTIEGSTLAAKNEFLQQISCGMGLSFDGPQVYYALQLAQGSWYRFSLSADFTAGLYLFKGAAGCVEGNVNVDCSTFGGTVLPEVLPGQVLQTAFSPTVTGAHVLAVDSIQPDQSGDFTVVVESYSPPGNMVCSAAEGLPIKDGVGTVVGSTASFLNDQGAHVYCGASARFLGPQAYYKVNLGKTPYRFRLAPKFNAVMALGGSCQTLAADCGSAGLAGAVLPVPPGSEGTLVFAPSAAGSFVVAVDSTTPAESGEFRLTVEDASADGNDLCSTPKSLSVPPGATLSFAGDTGPLKNDLSGINCGQPNGPWPGPQAYYRLPVPGGVTAAITLVPTATFDAALYAFPAATACEAAAVNQACSSWTSDHLGGGKTESLALAPLTDTDYIVVVDSWSPSEVGSFTLQVAMSGSGMSDGGAPPTKKDGGAADMALVVDGSAMDGAPADANAAH